ncbi:hypothetical protein B0H14DRAFT_3150155 [Mycena olivaceomarginata]|nr:hypothetical protein B0H14DRAFT_3150155 [Mycena olivaceomarginata]
MFKWFDRLSGRVSTGRGRSAPAPPISAPFLDTRNGTVSPIPAIRKNIERLASGLARLATIAEPFSRSTPLQGPISILIACIELMHTVSNNHSAIEELAIQFSRRLDLVNDALIKARSEGAEQRISKFAGILIEESQKLDALSKRGVVAKIVLSEEDVQTIAKSISYISSSLDNFQIDVVLSIERNTDGAIDLLNAIRIDSWPRSKHATYCAGLGGPETRVTILEHIKQWAEEQSPSSPRVFWLTGHAGSGKSTIAYSISQHYCASHVLAANFFCSRQFEDTTSRQYIVPSIVHQFAKHSNSFHHALLASNQFWVSDDPSEHLKTLLVDPWRKCLDDRKFRNPDLKILIPSLLIVIDALDEIADGEGAIFLRELLDAVRDGEFADLCKDIAPAAVYHLQQVPTDDVDEDIKTFLHAKLPVLNNKPQLQELVRQSDGLFIFAATAVRYITPRVHMTPEEQFTLLQKFLGPGPNHRDRILLDKLYQQILWSAFSGLEDEQFFTRLRALHAILAIPSVQTVPTIAQLDSMFTVSLVEVIVKELHAVLYIKADSRICWYHASFPDFIFDSKRSIFPVEYPGNETRTVDMSCSINVRLEFMQKLVRIEKARREQQIEERRMAQAFSCHTEGYAAPLSLPAPAVGAASMPPPFSESGLWP